jgi:hypothetical protein
MSLEPYLVHWKSVLRHELTTGALLVRHTYPHRKLLLLYIPELFLALLHALHTFAHTKPKTAVSAVSLVTMIQPSRILRTAQRAHKGQQENLWKQGLLRCKDCHLCFLADDHEIKKAKRGSDAPFTQQHEYKQCS